MLGVETPKKKDKGWRNGNEVERDELLKSTSIQVEGRGRDETRRAYRGTSESGKDRERDRRGGY